MALLLAAALPGCAASNGGTSRDASRGDAGANDDVDAGATEEVDAARTVRCGDLFCDRPTETCETCPLDCNECPTCDMAPTCTGALAVPTSTEPLAVCDNTLEGTQRTNYACGEDLGVAPNETTCADPQLRIRIREISIERGFFDVERNLFCVISAEDGAHSELLLTTPRPVAGNRNTTTLNLRPGEGTLWGQGDLFRSISNLTITYACFLTSDTESAQGILDAIADRAAEASEHAGEYGYVFGAVAVLGTIIGSSLGAVSDDQILDVQQTIDAGALLEMTNGRTWEIRQQIGNLSLSGASDLRLVVESWGCAEPRAIFE
ncbi:hypothetical protein [Sandaracinus amylolyticus]|uniref:Uncharacterized protein n=1 Tax=Sandaracinus amylolyticus TaxID=927083 RepID=A0A0F6VYP6_9BACT|nr:hypothetical protein [Sandaracinus amylolyticus]AKF02980.1 hypothetical protein DB32_000128 [Sandaracinus amylolyticus]